MAVDETAICRALSADETPVYVAIGAVSGLLLRRLQAKAEWGNDVEVTASVLDLASIEGGSGTVALFDNSGSHRSGLIISGRRVSIHGGFR